MHAIKCYHLGSDSYLYSRVKTICAIYFLKKVLYEIKVGHFSMVNILR